MKADGIYPLSPLDALPDALSSTCSLEIGWSNIRLNIQVELLINRENGEYGITTYMLCNHCNSPKREKKIDVGNRDGKCISIR